MEQIEIKSDLSVSIRNISLMFKSSDPPWSRNKNKNRKDVQNKVTDGPFIFKTDTGRLGMIWTSWVYNVYTQGVAYSESGTLDGPWVHESDPITPPNFGHGMIFKTFEGRDVMAAHSHYVDENGHYIRHPTLVEVNLKGVRPNEGDEYKTIV